MQDGSQFEQICIPAVDGDLAGREGDMVEGVISLQEVTGYLFGLADYYILDVGQWLQGFFFCRCEDYVGEVDCCSRLTLLLALLLHSNVLFYRDVPNGGLTYGGVFCFHFFLSG